MLTISFACGMSALNHTHQMPHRHAIFNAQLIQVAINLLCSAIYFQNANGLLRELNPGPLAPEARIMPLDQAANATRVS